MYKMKEIKRAVKHDKNLKQLLIKSGVKDMILFDITSDKQPDIALIDTTGDGYLDTIALDTDGSGRFDTLLADTDGNDIPDTVMFGDIENGAPSEIIHGKDVEDTITDIVNQLVSAIMLDLFTEAAEREIAEAVYSEILYTAQALDEACREEEKLEKKAAFEAKRIQRSEERKQKLEAFGNKIKGIIKSKQEGKQ